MRVTQKVRPGGLKFNSLSSKLVAAFLAMGLLPAGIIGVYANANAMGDLKEAAGERMADAAVSSGRMIDRNLFERYGDVQAFAANPKATGSPAEQQDLVDFLTGAYGVYDLVMIADASGTVTAVNSVDSDGSAIESSALLGTDVSNEDWFTTVAEGRTPEGGTYYTDAHQSDLVSRAYGEKHLTLPFSAPITDESGEIVGVWHNEVSFERTVGNIFDAAEAQYEKNGLGSFQSHLIDGDGLVLRGPVPQDALATNLIDEGVAAAQDGVDSPGAWGFDTGPDEATGEETLFGYYGLDGFESYEGYHWAVVVAEAASEAQRGAFAARNAMLVIAAILAFLVVVIGLFMGRSVARPLRINADKLKKVAKGDLTVDFEVNSADEVGQTADALNSALGAISSTLAEVDSSAGELTSASAGLTRLSDEMASNAKQTAGQATDVVAASEQISASSTAVAAAMEEMGASVREIAENTAEAARMTFSAVEASSLARNRMEKLDASATDIGNVIGVITSIAEQTNLLALNATIEAARVGEAGKGFAVVANEVKALAQQTATATEEIQAKIEAIQSDAAGAVDAITEISGLIDKVNEIATAIAGAVEEQSATTSEVSHSIHQVTVGTANIASSIGAVAEAADQTRDGASHAQQSAAELDRLASRLKQLLARFEIAAGVDRPGGPARPAGGRNAVVGTVAVNDLEPLVPSGWD
ncbi:MAG: methyl-accepting chemotaxis protein [Acidimicrobiales bacterium]